MAGTSLERGLPLEKIPRKAELRYTERWSQEALLAWRLVGDPLADAVAEALAATGDLKDIHSLLGTVQERAASEGGVFKAFMDEVSTPPEWADFSRMERGQQMITRYLHLMQLSLALGSLVAVGTQFPAPVAVVNATNMLSVEDPVATRQRLGRTTRFTMDLATPGLIEPGRDGWASILQVRLLHGAVRQYVRDSERYERKEEPPVNQHDLAITLGLFGYINLRNLRRIGVSFSSGDEEAFVHLWRYMGWVLGIRNDLLPQSLADQQAFFLASTKLCGDGGASYADQIVKAFDAVPAVLSKKLTRGMFPPSAFDGTQYHLLNLFAGEEYIGCIHEAGGMSGRPAPWFISALQATGRITAFVEQYVPFGGRMLHSMALRSRMASGPSREKSPHMLRSRL